MFLFLGGTFKPGFEVTANFARAGQLLRAGSDVKIRGVLVGAVKNIDITRSGKARIELRIFPEQEIPRNVGAAIRAKTLFGEKFVELQIPDAMEPGNLREGDEIPESRTIPPFEVETILEKGVPVLNAIDPEAFGAALHALAEGFVGNEQALRNATLQSEKLLTETERTLPNLERNLVHLKNFAAALNDTDDSVSSRPSMDYPRLGKRSVASRRVQKDDRGSCAAGARPRRRAYCAPARPGRYRG